MFPYSQPSTPRSRNEERHEKNSSGAPRSRVRPKLTSNIIPLVKSITRFIGCFSRSHSPKEVTLNWEEWDNQWAQTSGRLGDTSLRVCVCTVKRRHSLVSLYTAGCGANPPDRRARVVCASKQESRHRRIKGVCVCVCV